MPIFAFAGMNPPLRLRRRQAESAEDIREGSSGAIAAEPAARIFVYARTRSRAVVLRRRRLAAAMVAKIRFIGGDIRPLAEGVNAHIGLRPSVWRSWLRRLSGIVDGGVGLDSSAIAASI